MHTSKRWEVTIGNCVCLAVMLVDTRTIILCQLPTPAILLCKFTIDRCIFTCMTTLLCCTLYFLGWTNGEIYKLSTIPCAMLHPAHHCIQALQLRIKFYYLVLTNSQSLRYIFWIVHHITKRHQCSLTC